MKEYALNHVELKKIMRMKKLIMMLMLVAVSLGAFAQAQKGASSAGLTIGYGFDSENATIGVDYRYCITDAVRLAPSLT